MITLGRGFTVAARTLPLNTYRMNLTIRPLAMHEWAIALEVLHASLDDSVRGQAIADDIDRLKKSPALAAGFLGAFRENILLGFILAEALPDNVMQFRGPFFCDNEFWDFREHKTIAAQLLAELE